jgi:hypothetical protein
VTSRYSRINARRFSIPDRSAIAPLTAVPGCDQGRSAERGGGVGQLAPGGRLVAGDLAAVLFVRQGVVQPWRWFAARRVSEPHR